MYKASVWLEFGSWVQWWKFCEEVKITQFSWYYTHTILGDQKRTATEQTVTEIRCKSKGELWERFKIHSKY